MGGLKDMWSIRMRASKLVGSQQPAVNKTVNSQKTIDYRLSTDEIHISGAEGLYESSEILRVLKEYALRALSHTRGKPDKVVITIENIKQKPRVIASLPVTTIECSSPKEAKRIVSQMLTDSGISKKAINRAFALLIRKKTMRGAAIIAAEKGNRLEPDRLRGIRASRLGIDKAALRMMSSRLSALGINTDTVKEAIILASKVASCPHIVAELCISDDPDYTTGYVASKRFGYVRIPRIKHMGSRIGGRAFFVKEGVSVKPIIDYLEKTPVIIGKSAPCMGIMSLDEIIHDPHR